MGKRKKEMAERLKAAKKVTAIAKLNNAPTSPRKMRLVADTIRGVEVNHALDLLHYRKRHPFVLRPFCAAPSLTGRQKILTTAKSWIMAMSM